MHANDNFMTYPDTGTPKPHLYPALESPRECMARLNGVYEKEFGIKQAVISISDNNQGTTIAFGNAALRENAQIRPHMLTVGGGSTPFGKAYVRFENMDALLETIRTMETAASVDAAASVAASRQR